MYRMQNRKKDIRIYVRNKARYNPETKERDFLYVDITDFAGTTIGDIKENVRRRTRGAVKIAELFLNNVSLADDRSVAHYNLEDGSILETTSNPLWVSCLYIKAAEVIQQQRLHPADENVQKWTSKSLPKKYTIIGILLNSSNAYRSQPPHFPNLQDLVLYLESLGKKGATMHPNYTQADLAKMEMEFHRDFENKYDDPIAAFVDHHAVQLGYINPDEAERKLRRPVQTPVNRGIRNYPTNSGAAAATAGNRMRPAGVGGGGGENRNNNRRQVQICEDCETSLAVVYCTDCQNGADGHGISLCKRCSDLIHTGATRRRHNVADISQAPKTANSKPYVPRAFLAPFSILLAMFSALSDCVPKLSMTEDEIKTRAQSLTDTDLQDKQNGKYVGGFDCMENCLMAKGLVKKEASRTPTYALTDLGHVLGEKLFLFYRKLFAYLSSCRLPKLPDSISTACIGNRKICLLIDKNEREKGRLLKFAEDKGIDAQTRYLPAGDYIWILTPPMIDTRQKYTGNQSAAEVVLPFIVERKSWEDFENSVNSTRFQRQVNNMLGSGVKNCFFLMEGSPGALRYNATQQHQQHLKTMVEKLTFDYGFYVNYTASWMKSAQWLLWFTQLIVDAYKQGKLADSIVPYSEYSSRVAILNGGHPSSLHDNQIRRTHTWPAQLFVDHIFRAELGDRTLARTVREDLGLQGREKHLLVIEGLEQYNKKRQSTLNKCCTEVHDKPQQAEEIVDRMIGASIHNMVHYDITCYKQLYIQVMTGVHVMRTETDKETEQAHQEFMAGPKPFPQASGSNRPTAKQPLRKQKSPKFTAPSLSTNILAAINQFTRPDHMETEDNMLDISSRLTPNRDSSHDLPPGCSVANIPLARQPAQSRSRLEMEQNFKAFSGTGFTLGTGPSGRTPHSNSRATATVTGENQVLQPDSSAHSNRTMLPLDRFEERNSYQMGPFGDSLKRSYNVDSAIEVSGKDNLRSVGNPRNRSVSMLDDGRTDDIGNRPLRSGDGGGVESLVSSGLDKEDFADSQNEDQIFQEVLIKSKQDAGTIATDSQDDPELQLALMLSREDNASLNAGPCGHSFDQSLDKYCSNRENPERDKIDAIEIEDSQEDIDDGLKLAIEMSKQNSKDTDKGNVGNSSDNRENDHVDDDISSTVSLVRKTVISVEGSENVDDDPQLKLAIEMSKQTNTPEKLNDKDSDLHMLEAIERSKTDNTPHKIADFDHYLMAALELSIQEKSPPDAVHEDAYLKEAIERSKVDHTPKKAGYDLELEKAIEMSKVDHTPKRIGFEDRELKLAIERSIVEQSPKHASLKRKLDTGEICDIRKKSMKSTREDALRTEEIRESEHLHVNMKKVCKFCRANESKNAETREYENNEVIQIDSQSQELESAEPGFNSVSASELVVTEISKSDRTVHSDLLDSLNNNEGIKSFLDQRKKDSVQNQTENVCDSLANIQTHCDTVNSAEHLNSDMEEDEDFIPPSPNKSASNLSQLNSSLQSSIGRTPLSITLSGSRKMETEPSKVKSETEKLECTSEINNNSGNGLSDKTKKTNSCRRESKATDFSLKTSLFRFVDENASESDYDSYDDDDRSGSDNDSFKSAEDIFTEPDNDTESDFGLKKSTDVQEKNTNSAEVPYGSESENVPNIRRVSNLVNRLAVNQNSHTSNTSNSKQNSGQGGQSNAVRSLCELDILPTEIIMENIKKEKEADTEKASGNNKYMKDTPKESVKGPKIKRKVAIKQEPIDQISPEVVQKEFSDFYTYDSEMDEVDFNPDLDDIDHDPTYEAGKNDLDSSDSSDHDNDTSEDDALDEFISKVDPEFLPQINRPKQRRKKTPKKEATKKTATTPEAKSVKIKREKLDNFDVKLKIENPDRSAVSTEMDAVLAKLLDKQINKGVNNSIHSSKSRIVDNDKLYARQVQTESQAPTNSTVDDETLAKRYQIVLNCGATDYNETEELVKELQRRELEKLERMRRTVEEDERIARMMQDNPDLDQAKPEVVNPIDVKDPVDEKDSAIPRNFRKLFAEEKTTAQVDDYRRNQSQRYQLAHTLGWQPGRPEFTVGLTDTRQDDDNILYRRLLNDQQNSSCNNQLLDRPSQSLNSGFLISQSQAGQGTPSYKINQSQSSNFAFTQPEAGQLTPQSQSKPTAAERNVNTTCGNCGEKGHTRVNPNCPRYHTAEESLRREAQQESRRQKQEEKKREEQENINMLSRHQQAILEMNNQLEAEVSAIQNNLHQRARELERQVNSRVKKIEIAEKRKKKK